MTTDEALAGLQARVVLPAGLQMVIDRQTHNILIHDADVGFAVTELYCRDHDLDSIVENVNGVLADVDSYKSRQPTDALLNPPTDTEFDS